MLNGRIHYNLSFSIDMLNYQRVSFCDVQRWDLMSEKHGTSWHPIKKVGEWMFIPPEYGWIFGWWFGTCLIFHQEESSKWTNTYFSDGFFLNHQPDMAKRFWPFLTHIHILDDGQWHPQVIEKGINTTGQAWYCWRRWCKVVDLRFGWWKPQKIYDFSI